MRNFIYEDIQNGSFDYVEELEPIYELELEEGETCEQCGATMKEGDCMECGMKESEIYEKLYGKQHKLDKNKNGKLDSEDFRMLRKKREVKEKLYGKQYKIDKNKNNKIDAQDFKMLRKEDETIYEMVIDDSDFDTIIYEIYHEELGTNLVLSEEQVVNLIERLAEEKLEPSKKTRGYSEYEKAHKRSGKENDDYYSEVVKKIKKYMKDGSKDDFSFEPKHFPKGNGELAKMDKKAYVQSDDVAEYVENFTAAGLENIDYDEIGPNEEWVSDNIKGSSKTGNNPKWANAVETEVNERRDKVRKNNLLGKLKRKAYNKAPQPIVKDRTGSDDASDLMDKLENKSSKKTKKINEDIERISNLLQYNRKTQ